MNKLKKLNDLLKNHQSATMRSYTENDEYLTALRQQKELQARRGQTTTKVDKKLGKLNKLMPAKKV